MAKRGATTAAAIYCRISDDREGKGLGVKRQQTDCEALCAARGWPMAAVYVDDSRSAYSGRSRPAYERMMTDLEAGRLDAVVAWHPDRLHRSPVELERFIDVVESAGVSVATVQGGEYDLSTASGRMTARVVGAVARHESEHKAERHKAKAAELARAGKVGGGGTRPYGYEADRVTINRAEAKHVREAARRVLAGEAVRGVCRDFNARGIPTVTGVTWTQQAMRGMLKAPRIAGLREHRGEVVGDAVWPGIITRAQHEQLVAILSDPTRRTNRGARSNLLAGFLRCQHCGTRLVSRPRQDRKRTYVCASGPGFGGCGGIRIVADELEALVVESTMLRLDSPALLDALRTAPPDDSDDDPAAELAALERRADDLAVAWADGQLDQRSWLAARARLDDRITAARARLTVRSSSLALVDYVGVPGALRKRWPKLSIDQRRAVLDAIIDRVTIGPAVRGRNRFDPSRVDVTWRV